MKAKPVTYKGINFRSTLEVKHYINMTEVFGWEVEYEPTIEGLRGWLPDFLIKGCRRDILVEVKPIRCFEEWANLLIVTGKPSIVGSYSTSQPKTSDI